MRVKLGPYKVPVEFWKRLQQLPGGNDEQRVLMGLDFACSHIEEEHAKRHQAQAHIAKLVEQERAKLEPADVTVETPGPLPPGHFLVAPDAVHSFEPHPDDRMEASSSDPWAFEVGETIIPTPEQLGFDPGPPDGKTSTVVVTAVDHEQRTITLETP